jgi:hypothetical protein
MKTRIAIWAVAGAIVVAFWSIFFMTTHLNLGASGIGRAIVCFTCPIALAGRHPQSLYFVLVANAATYALVGVVVEVMRRHYRIHSISN